MKRLKFFGTSIPLILVMITACEDSQPLDAKTNGELILRKKSSEIIKLNQSFAFQLFREVCNTSKKDNIMISPLSVSYALGMTYNGAASATLEAFNDVLHFEDLTPAEVNESYKDLMDQMVRLDPQVKFSIANSIWYDRGFPVLQEFISTNKTWFDAAVRELNFAEPSSVDIINSWIESKTNDKIKDMLDQIPADAVMYLINAVYFNGSWKYRFDKNRTQTGAFYREDGTKIQTQFMKIKKVFNCKFNEDFRAVELPYGDSTFSMLVFVPAGDKKLGDLVMMMNAADHDTWFSSYDPVSIQVELPKFRYSYGGVDELLNDPLKNLGLSIAFDPGADFSRIVPGGGIWISRVIHQTFIDVQEEGTEAAAATIVEMVKGMPAILRIDRPFLYIIRENSTGAILFMGKVGKPEYPSVSNSAELRS